MSSFGRRRVPGVKEQSIHFISRHDIDTGYYLTISFPSVTPFQLPSSHVVPPTLPQSIPHQSHARQPSGPSISVAYLDFQPWKKAKNLLFNHSAHRNLQFVRLTYFLGGEVQGGDAGCNLRSATDRITEWYCVPSLFGDAERGKRSCGMDAESDFDAMAAMWVWIG